MQNNNAINEVNVQLSETINGMINNFCFVDSPGEVEHADRSTDIILNLTEGLQEFSITCKLHKSKARILRHVMVVIGKGDNNRNKI
jgi:hypothetical protein